MCERLLIVRYIWSIQLSLSEKLKTIDYVITSVNFLPYNYFKKLKMTSWGLKRVPRTSKINMPTHKASRCKLLLHSARLAERPIYLLFAHSTGIFVFCWPPFNLWPQRVCALGNESLRLSAARWCWVSHAHNPPPPHGWNTSFIWNMGITSAALLLLSSSSSRRVVRCRVIFWCKCN